MTITEKDNYFMKRALALAAKATGMTSPNPVVGAVLVKNGTVIAEDFHKKTGELHAEALVIKHAGEKAKDSTLYVTLEPCCHTDKRTPPCTKAIINAGIKKIFVATKDPNPKVSGKGIAELRKHGIQVVEGLLEARAKKLNEAYAKFITTKTPFVVLKVAMTLDGKIATPEGQSKWITGEKARKVVHRMRNSVDAVMTAVGTVKADNPQLTVRLGVSRGQKTRNPKRILIDPNLETPVDYKIFNKEAETILVTRMQAASNEKIKLLSSMGVKIIGHEGKRVNLKSLILRLGETGITSLIIEAGSSFSASALQEGIVDKVVFFIAPKLIGGKDSVPAIGGSMFRKLEDAHKIYNMKVKKVGEDLMIEGYLQRII